MPQSNTTAVLENGVLTVTTDQRPEPALFGEPLGSGNFPDNPNSVDSQTNDGFAFTIRAGTNTSNPQATTLGPQGIVEWCCTIQSICRAWLLPGQTVFPAPNFNWNAVYNAAAYGVDKCGGHPEQDGEYHYHDGSFLVNCWGNALVQSNVYYSSSQFEGNFSDILMVILRL